MSPISINNAGGGNGYRTDMKELPTGSKEVPMKSRRMIAFIGLALLIAAVPALRGSETGPEALIARARAVVLTPDPPSQGIATALGDALTASLMILPKTGYAEEYRSLIGNVQKALDEESFLSEKVYHDLQAAYGLVSGGRPWQLPEELKSSGGDKNGIELATKHCAKILDSALAELKAGRNEQAVGRLLEFVILVVTPIER